MATEGNVQSWIRKGTVPNVIEAPVSGHTQKPAEFYEIMETICPHGPYLDVFARKNNWRTRWFSVGLDLGAEDGIIIDADLTHTGGHVIG